MSTLMLILQNMVAFYLSIMKDSVLFLTSYTIWQQDAGLLGK